MVRWGGGASPATQLAGVLHWYPLHRLTVACEAQHRRYLSAAAQAAPTLPVPTTAAAAAHSQSGAGDDDTT